MECGRSFGNFRPNIQDAAAMQCHGHYLHTRLRRSLWQPGFYVVYYVSAAKYRVIQIDKSIGQRGTVLYCNSKFGLQYLVERPNHLSLTLTAQLNIQDAGVSPELCGVVAYQAVVLRHSSQELSYFLSGKVCRLQNMENLG